MATPHIAGAMALLWSAIPSLRHQLTASRDALNNSAVHIASTQCGDAGPPNNVYGWGRVDIFAAVGGGGTPTPTPTATPTATATATASATCYSDSDRHANGQPYCNGVGNRHAATDANTQSGAIRKAAPHASAEAIDFTRRKISGDRSSVLSSSVEEIDDRMPHCGSSSVGTSHPLGAP